MSISNIEMLTLLLLVTLVSCTPKGFRLISDSVDDSYKGSAPKKGWRVSAAKDREYLYDKGYLGFVDFDNDTLFCIQDFNISTGNLSTTFWNRKKAVSLINSGNKRVLEVHEDVLIAKKMANIIQQWDTITLVRLSNEADEMYDDSDMYVSRIVIRDSAYNTQSIIIRQFIHTDYDLPQK